MCEPLFPVAGDAELCLPQYLSPTLHNPATTEHSFCRITPTARIYSNVIKQNVITEELGSHNKSAFKAVYLRGWLYTEMVYLFTDKPPVQVVTTL